jgi:ABC-type glycerol-3-phosphate transport system permease component
MTVWLRSRTTRGRLGVYIAFLVYAVCVLFPLYWIAISSVTPLGDLFQSPPSYFPRQLTFENYRHMASSLPFRTYLTNSIIFAVGSAALAVFVSFLAAYAFARYEFRGRTFLFVLLMLSVALPQIATVIPLFRLFKSLELVNTPQGLILLMGSLLAPFTIWSLTAFIRQVPREIEEAARIDGAGVFTVMWRVIVPLTSPALATLFLINFVITWNELFYPLIFASSTDVKPLTLGLVELVRSGGTIGGARPWDLMSALSMVMIVPPVILVVAFQRLFVKGLTRGALN